MNNQNIFDSPMASFEFLEKVADRIAYDWLEEDVVSPDGLYSWIEGGFKDSILKRVRRKVEK